MAVRTVLVSLLVVCAGAWTWHDGLEALKHDVADEAKKDMHT